MKKKFYGKALAALISAACAVNGLVVSNFAGAAEADVYEFETGTISTADRIFTGEDREGNAVEASGGSFVFLQDAGETATVEFTLTCDDFRFYNVDLDYVWEPGEIRIFIGKNSLCTEYKTVMLAE